MTLQFSFLSSLSDKLKLKNFAGRLLVIALPYGWHIIFFLIPFFIIFGLSFSESVLHLPPYKPLITWTDHVWHLRLDLSHYKMLFEDNFYLKAYGESLIVSATSTFFCLLVAYPMAYGISRAAPGVRLVLLMMVILPFWTSFLIRVYAWIGILSPQGFLNALLMNIGLIKTPLKLLNTRFAVIIGIVYSYLPFMILPLYTALQKINPQLLEAAFDLGCRPLRAFCTVTLRLSLQGIIAGSILVFIPAVGEFVIPELLGGSDRMMIGKVLWTEFFTHRDWPMAATVAVALLVGLVIPMIFCQRLMIRLQERHR